MIRRAQKRRLQVLFDPSDNVACSFCGKTIDEVRMAAGPTIVNNAYLCFECLVGIMKHEAERLIARSDNRWIDLQRANDLRSIIDQISEISSSNSALLPHIAGFLEGLIAKSRNIEEERGSDS